MIPPFLKLQDRGRQGSSGTRSDIVHNQDRVPRLQLTDYGESAKFGPREILKPVSASESAIGGEIFDTRREVVAPRKFNSLCHHELY